MSDSGDQVAQDEPLSNIVGPAWSSGLESHVPTEREGLPRGYRMRADRHYVEQIAAPSTGHPVRMLPIADVECQQPETSNDLRPLIESIRTHGIVHPLLVRRHGDGWAVIAGRKRFAAAQILRLASVPCLIHDISDSDVAGLAAADDLRTASTLSPALRDAAAACQMAAAHVDRVLRAADMPLNRGDGLDACAADLLKAHAWRARQLLAAVELLERAPASSTLSSCAVASVIDEVVQGFAPEARLRGFALRVEVDDAQTLAVDRQCVAAAVVGAILLTLHVVDPTTRPAIVVKCARGAGTLMIEVLQSDCGVTQRTLDALRVPNPISARAADCAATIAAVTIHAVAERIQATADFHGSPAGSRIVMTFPVERNV